MKCSKLLQQFCAIAIFILVANIVFNSVSRSGSTAPKTSSSPEAAKGKVPRQRMARNLRIELQTNSQSKSAALSNGVSLPWVGFGTAGLGLGTQQAVQSAVDAGFRHIDTAQAREWYREDLVGNALNASSLTRESVFLTTKIHPRHFGSTVTLDVFANSLADLRTSYVDLILLHYPYCWGSLCGGMKPEGNWRDAWGALEQLYAAGRAKAIGVSNFNLHEMHQLLSLAKVKPHVLQIHIDPLSQNKELVSFCKSNEIQVEAYSALGTQWGRVGQDQHNPVLSQPLLREIGLGLNRSVAQVVLQWLLQQSIVVLPRSSNPEHQREALSVISDKEKFELSMEQMESISKLDGTKPE